MFDMTQCKLGDKLITRDSRVAELTCYFESGQSPYAITFPDGTWWACRRDGMVYKGEEHALDIVGFAPQVAPQAIQQITIVAKPSFVLSFDGKDVTLTLDELKALSVKIINLIGED